MQRITVWAVSFEGRQFEMGCDALFMTEDEAMKHVANWCRSVWTREGLLGDPPTDRDELIEAYFAPGRDESYDISQVELPAAIVEAIAALRDVTEALANAVLELGDSMPGGNLHGWNQTAAKAREIYRELLTEPKVQS